MHIAMEPIARSPTGPDQDGKQREASVLRGMIHVDACRSRQPLQDILICPPYVPGVDTSLFRVCEPAALHLVMP